MITKNDVMMTRNHTRLQSTETMNDHRICSMSTTAPDDGPDEVAGPARLDVSIDRRTPRSVRLGATFAVVAGTLRVEWSVEDIGPRWAPLRPSSRLSRRWSYFIHRYGSVMLGAITLRLRCPIRLSDGSCSLDGSSLKRSFVDEQNETTDEDTFEVQDDDNVDAT